MITTIGREMLAFQDELAHAYHYKPVEYNIFFVDVREKYRRALPSWCRLDGDTTCALYAEKETQIATGYTRIVIGDYGAYVEISPKRFCRINCDLPQERSTAYTTSVTQRMSNIIGTQP